MNDLMTCNGSRNGGQLSAPVRNRYFYGKLLDVHNLELEQQYFLEMGRLVNRLTVGSGVLCGLHVTAAADGTITVSPGVAVDGCGREIVVTETVKVDLSSLELEQADGTAVDPATITQRAAQNAAANVWSHPDRRPCGSADGLLCVSYDECPVEPTPVLIADCDLREECVPGAVRERFKLALMSPADAPLPEDPCAIMGRSTEVTPGDERVASARIIDTLSLYGPRAGIQVRAAGGDKLENTLADPAATTTVRLRERLCHSYQPPCKPGSDCVPIALLTRTTLRGAVAVNECAPRTTVYSNAVLLDLILCLAQKVDDCCGRKVTLTAPKIVGIAPTPGAEITAADFDKLKFSAPGIAISFDTAMRKWSLEHPDEWLRVLAFEATGTAAAARPIGLVLDRTEAKTLDGKKGQTAYYTFTFTGGDRTPSVGKNLKSYLAHRRRTTAGRIRRRTRRRRSCFSSRRAPTM